MCVFVMWWVIDFSKWKLKLFVNYISLNMNAVWIELKRMMKVR